MEEMHSIAITEFDAWTAHTEKLGSVLLHALIAKLFVGRHCVLYHFEL